MSKKIKMSLGILAAVFLAAEPLMMLWQPLLPQGSYAGIATFVAVVRAALVYYTTTEEGEEDASIN